MCSWYPPQESDQKECQRLYMPDPQAELREASARWHKYPCLRTCSTSKRRNKQFLHKCRKPPAVYPADSAHQTDSRQKLPAIFPKSSDNRHRPSMHPPLLVPPPAGLLRLHKHRPSLQSFCRFSSMPAALSYRAADPNDTCRRRQRPC